MRWNEVQVIAQPGVHLVYADDGAGRLVVSVCWPDACNPTHAEAVLADNAGDVVAFGLEDNAAILIANYERGPADDHAMVPHPTDQTRCLVCDSRELDGLRVERITDT